MSRCACGAFAIVAACSGGSGAPSPAAKPVPGSGSAAPSAATAGPASASPSCTQLPFAGTTPVPEASGAAWISIEGKPALLVVGDSGNHGAYGIVDPQTGATIETGRLPLSDEAGDDIEGVAAVGELIYGLTSAGWVRSWRRTGQAFELVDRAYPLGPVTLPDTRTSGTRHEHRAPQGDGMVCDGQAVNCGRNYEGLCLAAAPRSPACIGFAASKTDGVLYCLTREAGKLVVHHDRAIAITRPGALADCTFSDDDTLWAGSNLFDLGEVYRVSGWDDPAAARLERVGALAIGFPEVIAVRGDTVYRMSDTGGAPSMMARFRCPK